MAAKRRFVVFDLGGVLVGSGLLEAFRRLEGSLGLPGNFFQDVIVQGSQDDGPFSRAMCGQIGLTQLMAELEENCKKAAAASGLSLPDKFSVAQAFEDITNEESVNKSFLQAALILRNNGFKIAVLTNNWVDDSPQRHQTALLFCLLQKYFDAVIESCRIGLQKPDPKIYEYTLEVLKAKPQEVIFLDDVGANLKPAREMGMATILVKDADSALKELQDLTGIQPQTCTFALKEMQGFVLRSLKLIQVALSESRIVGCPRGFLDHSPSILYLAAANRMHRKSSLSTENEGDGYSQLVGQENLPLSCNPENVAHGYVTIKPGTQLHFVELGSGPPVCLCHGFPESWFSWRYQIPALADAGFRVLALEMKGYGVSTAPPDVGPTLEYKNVFIWDQKLKKGVATCEVQGGRPKDEDIEEYSQQEICKDLVIFLDKLGISQAVFIGHDWGGATVWNMALFYPERVRAVASLNTPFKPADPKVDIMEMIRSIPVFDYQLYFQEPGVAEAELEKNLRRTFTIMIRSTKKEDQLPGVSLNVSKVRERGGILVGLPEDPPPSSLLPEPVLQYYIQQYQKSGFRGPLNWYRNMKANWSWNASAQGRKIRVPALMVTAGKDKVLHPNMSKHMEEWIPQLTRGHIEECGHFTQMERPAALNKILIEWLREVHQNASLQTTAKL